MQKLKIIALLFALFIPAFTLASLPCVLQFENHSYPCAHGRMGVSLEKKEGDGSTPGGEFPLRAIYYRADRIKINAQLPLIKIQPNDAWCDDIRFKEYNMPVKLPHKGSYEQLWRQDHVYDVIVVLGYNDNPVIKGKGSAIFLHIARPRFSPTAGCVALKRKDLLKILPRLTPSSRIQISQNGHVLLKNE